ncbi:DNA adenine methylase [Brevibacillus brevis]|uniref:DNA adenine methylase n=1 Tax=Brevibacillus brevis TaxID=1393 RepID=UPI0037CB8BA8
MAMRRSRSLINANGHPRSVISFIGGKKALIPNIVPIIEYCADAYSLKSYYEVCGGGARMLLNLRPELFQHRVYNDLDLGLCKLFACLGDKGYLYDLMALLENLGCGEDVFLQAKHAREFEARMMSHGADFELDMVNAAAYAFILAMQSRAADMVTFDTSRVTDRKRLSSYFKRIRELDLYYPTLADVEVTHGDCRELLDLICVDSSVFAYIDPPYTPESMSMVDHYGERSWKNSDHDALVDKLLESKIKAALSGYDNTCYDRLVAAGWRKLYLKNISVSSSVTKGRRSDEYLWINFEIPSSLEDQVSQFAYNTY